MSEIEFPSPPGNRLCMALLVSIWALIYLVGCGYPPALLDDADTVHAEAAREMVQSGDWVTLHANQIRYLEKAPFMYWTVAASYRLLGVSEFSTRLPIALSTLALILVVFAFGKWAGGQSAGFYAALATATSAGIYLFTRVLWPDVILSLFLSLCFYSFLRAMEQPGSRWAYGMYGFSALAVLTKGLIGAVFPAAIIGLHLILTRNLASLRKLKPFSGTLLFLLIAVPWHLAAGFRNKTFFWFYFVNEHFLRYLGKRYPVDYDTVPLFLFIGLHLLWLFPWSFFLPLTARILPRRLRELDRQAQTELFLVLWIATIILFFSFSTRQEYYTMPTYPAFALLIGIAVARAEERPEGRLFPSLKIGLASCGVVIFFAAGTVLAVTRNLQPQRDIAESLTRNPQAYALSLGHVLDLTPQSMASLRLPLAGTALAFLAGAAALYLLRRKRLAWAIPVALTATAFFFFAHLSMATFEPYLSSKPLAEAIERRFQPGEMIVLNGEYEGGSSINFYTRTTVFILNGRSANLEYGSYFPDAPKLFLQDSDVSRLWPGQTRIYLFSEVDKLDRLIPLLKGNPVFRIAESGGKVILSNREQ